MVVSAHDTLRILTLIEHAVMDGFPKHPVHMMHAVTVPSLFWKEGRHGVAIDVHPFNDTLEFQLHRAAGFDAPADLSWNKAAIEFSRRMTPGTILRHVKVPHFRIHISSVDRRSADARKTGFNDCYAVELGEMSAHIREHGRNFQMRSSIDDPLHQAGG